MNPRTLVLLLFVPAVAFAADTDRPHGPNCDLAAPPASSGEDTNHGITLKIYPRAKDIDPAYSGCQALFAPNGQQWAVVALTEYVAGDPVRLWSEHETDPDRPNCRYKAGRVVQGNPDKCPIPRSLSIKSMAPGCVSKMQEAVAKGGLGASWPKECEYQ
jgi:hypothetical protein